MCEYNIRHGHRCHPEGTHRKDRYLDIISLENSLTGKVKTAFKLPSCKSPESTSKRSTSFSYIINISVDQSNLLLQQPRRRDRKAANSDVRAQSASCALRTSRSHPSHHCTPGQISHSRSPSTGRRCAPKVRFGERRFLVTEEPSVCVRRVDHVEVTPYKRSGRRGKRRRRVGASRVYVVIAVPVSMTVLVVGTRERDRCQRQDRQERGKLHTGSPKFHLVRTASPMLTLIYIYFQPNEPGVIDVHYIFI